MTKDSPCFGYCKKCDTVHSLSEGPARAHALALFAKLKEEGCLDYDVPKAKRNPLFSTESLYTTRVGQMFGVLVAKDGKGKEIVLKAFSSQQNGEWEVPGWSPPLVPMEKYLERVRAGGKIITELTARIKSENHSEQDMQSLKNRRKSLSQNLMKELHGMYRLHNFCGDIAGLEEAFVLDKGIPSGVGDCCAPKLLNEAAKQGLKPLGIAEFFLGRDSQNGSKKEGEFYPVCVEKCQPIMGFMLCGVAND